MSENVLTSNNPSVRQINEDEDSFFGCTFPLSYVGGNDGFFPRASSVKEQAASNLKNLLLTQKGERVGQPTFGSDLPRLLFEQRTDDISDSIDETIREAISNWLPYIEVSEIQTLFNDSRPNEVNVILEFLVTVDDPDSPETITFNFNTGD
tara:strand:- start:182 stop:634 length:453 start_codon:yes stop_codon:yes gene_type:complete